MTLIGVTFNMTADKDSLLILSVPSCLLPHEQSDTKKGKQSLSTDTVQVSV